MNVNRRRFMYVTAAAAGGVLLAGKAGQGAEPGVPPDKTGETPHFWYRLQPPGIYIDSQRGDMAFGYAGGKIFLSEDNGHTWSHSIAFPSLRG